MQWHPPEPLNHTPFIIAEINGIPFEHPQWLATLKAYYENAIKPTLDGLPEHSHKYYLVSQLTKAYLDTNRKDIKEFLTQVLQEYGEYFAKHSHYGRRAIIE